MYTKYIFKYNIYKYICTYIEREREGSYILHVTKNPKIQLTDVLRAPRYIHIIVLRLLVVNGGGIVISGKGLPITKLYDP